MSLGELAALVCSHLDSKGIPCVLSGGACVTIYTHHRYLSYDLDFIERFSTSRKELRIALDELGFYEEHRDDETLMTQRIAKLRVRNFCTETSYIEHIGRTSACVLWISA